MGKSWENTLFNMEDLVKQCHKPPMTGNGKHTTYKNGDDWVIIVLPTLQNSWV